MRARGLISLPLVLGLLLVGGAGAGAHGQEPTRSGGRSAVAPSVLGSTAPARQVRKVLVVVVENHSLAQMQRQMPWTASLARRFGYAQGYRGVGYPSLPNYLAISSGSTHGVTDDRSPPAHLLRGQTVFGQALAHGRTATLYADGMPSTCSLVNGGNDYVVKHNPWAYFPSERALCRQHDVPASAFRGDVARGTLPQVGMLIPNMCHDAHDCPLSVADSWVRTQLRRVLAGPDWQSGHLVLVVTADTDDRNDGNRVLTVVAHPSQHGRVVKRRLDHYSLSRMLSWFAGARALSHGRSAASMGRAFHLPSR